MSEAQLTKVTYCYSHSTSHVSDESTPSPSSLYTKAGSADTATAHHEFLVCSYENIAANEKNKEFITVCL